MFPEDIADIIYSNISDDCHQIYDLIMYFRLGPHDTFRQNVLARLATTEGYVEMIKQLCSNRKLNIDGHNGYLFFLACQFGFFPVVHWMLKYGKCHAITTPHECQSGHLGRVCNTQLGDNFIWAVKQGFVDIVRLLLTYESFDFILARACRQSPDIVMIRTLMKFTTCPLDDILFHAIGIEDVELVKLALVKDRHSDWNGVEILAAAVETGNTEILQLLRQHDDIWK